MVASEIKPVCAITGGSAGVGLAAAVRFGMLGYRLAICGRDAQALERARQQVAATSPACLAAKREREPA
jgi:short-subunit dehydrogenase involved in D-alanine esterification of teichoic acids